MISVRLSFLPKLLILDCTGDPNCSLFYHIDALILTEPPGKPLNLRASVNETWVTLTWERPLHDGGRDDMTYRYAWDVVFHVVFYSARFCHVLVMFQLSSSY